MPGPWYLALVPIFKRQQNNMPVSEINLVKLCVTCIKKAILNSKLVSCPLLINYLDDDAITSFNQLRKFTREASIFFYFSFFLKYSHEFNKYINYKT